jgi:hypothetical protein
MKKQKKGSLCAVVLSLLIGGVQARAEAATSGCPWLRWDASTQGIVDSNAAYFSSILPTKVAAGTTVQISGRFPKVRFFNFTVYHKGKLIDHLADAHLYPVEGGQPSPYVAAIPDSNNYTDTYRLTLRYEDAPSDPAQRAPNTLYAGSDSSQQGLLLMRLYLPDTGADATGDAGLPQLTQINPDGSSIRFDNIQNPTPRCQIIAAFTSVFDKIILPIPYIAPKNPTFAVVPESAYNGGPASTARYSNFDSGYAYALIGMAWADLAIVRAKMPATPITPWRMDNPDVRYMSFCEYEQWNRKIDGCLADKDFTLQSDGYVNIVLSQSGGRPIYADSAHGYGWMAAPAPGTSSILTLRQILADPSFPGSYQAASSAADPIAALGSWAPQVTYCDTGTFDNNALFGGAAVFAACQQAYASKSQWWSATH